MMVTFETERVWPPREREEAPPLDVASFLHFVSFAVWYRKNLDLSMCFAMYLFYVPRFMFFVLAYILGVCVSSFSVVFICVC